MTNSKAARGIVILFTSVLLLIYVFVDEFSHSALAKPEVGAQLAESVPLIQANRVHTELGITGDGPGVMVIDNFGNEETGFDRIPHGVRVKQIIKAVAPSADIWSCDAGGKDSEGKIVLPLKKQIECLEQAKRLNRTGDFSIINMSYGNDCKRIGRRDELIRELHQQGIVFVAASGNEQQLNAIDSPACLSEVISVGAVYDGRIRTNIESEVLCGSFEQGVLDKVACYSNSASTLDVLAPGSRINAGVGDICDRVSSVLPYCLENFSGTSLAAPHVTGTIALILEVNPNLSLEQVREILTDTGKKVIDHRTKNNETFPRVDAYEAVLEAQRRREVSTPTLTISSSLEPTPNEDSARAKQDRDTFEYEVTGLTPDGPVRVFVRYPDGHREEPSPEFIPDFADSNGELTWSFSPSCNMEPGQYTVWAVDTKTDKKSNRATQEILPNPACDTESMSKNGRTDIILLVDRTGSMVESGLITPARNVAQQFVSLMNPGDKVGVVSFTTQATVEYPLSLIDDSENQIDEAVSAIGQIQAGGDTSVGTGLIEAFRQVRRQGRENAQQAVILLSDAFENTAPWVIPHEGEPGVLNQYPNSPPVHAIALGSETDQGLLQVIADSTGGEYHFSPTGLDLQTIYQQISGSIGQQSLVSSSTSKVNPGQLQEVTNWISSDFLNSVHSVFWSGSRLAVRLRSPNGNTITPEKARKSDRFQYHEGNTFATYEVSSPEPGKWTLLVEGVEVPQDGENFAVTVGGQSSIDLNLYFAQSSYTTGQPVKIYGTVNSETLPVSLALLTLQVRSPNGSALTSEASKGEHVVPSAPIRQEVAQLQLYDDGQHGDGEARDGVYANTFNNTSRPGSYIFKLKAVGLSGMSLFSQMTRRAVYVAPSQNTQRTTMFQQEESRFNLASVSIGNTSFSSQSSILFEAQGQGIAKTKLSIYDLSGRQVYESELTEGATLRWNKRNEVNEPVANGVYLYQLVAQGAGGQMERSSIQKLAILR